MSGILSGALSIGRRAAENRMTETVEVVERVTTTNEDTLVTTHNDTVVWSGIARYASRGAASGDIRDGKGQTFTAIRKEIHTQTSAPILRPGLIVKITGSTSDPLIAGNEFTIVTIAEAGQTTAHRYVVEGVDVV